MERLKEFLIQDKFDFTLDKKTLNDYSEDTSLFKILPKIIIYPRNKFEISKLLQFIEANPEEKYNLVSRAGGTDMSGGAIGNSIILSFTKYFKNILQIDQEKKEATVEPGVYYRDFEKETLKSDLILPSFPASREICTVGGMVANNSGGEKSLAYGKTEKYVLELEVVLANGEIVRLKKLNEIEFKEKLNSLNEKSLEFKIYKAFLTLLEREENQKIIQKNIPKVSKNSAGYNLWDILTIENGEKYIDLTKLITGSQGTLGIITEIKFVLIRPKKYSKLLLIFLKDLEDLSEVRMKVLKYKPESFESYDKYTFKIALKFLPALIQTIFKINKNSTKQVNIFRLGFSFWREVKMLLTFGMPELFLLAEFTGDDETEIEERIIKAKKALAEIKNLKTRYIKSDFENEKYWIIRRESFNLLRKKVKGLHTAPFIDDIIVSGDKLKDFLEALIPILKKYKLLYTIAGHIGDGNLHIIPLMNFENQNKITKNIEIIKNCSREVYNLIHKFKGSITAEHNDGLIRTPFLFEMYDSDMLRLFKEVKNIFDKENILNPNKKVSASNNFETEFENNLKYLKFGK